MYVSLGKSGLFVLFLWLIFAVIYLSFGQWLVVFAMTTEIPHADEGALRYLMWLTSPLGLFVGAGIAFFAIALGFSIDPLSAQIAIFTIMLVVGLLQWTGIFYGVLLIRRRMHSKPRSNGDA